MMRIFKMMLVLSLMAGAAFGQSGGKVEAIESGITLRLTSPITPEGKRKFVLHAQTNDVYECTEASISNTAKLDGSKLLITLKDVRKPDPCSGTMAPATCQIDLTELKHGAYKVRFNINRQIFKARLELSDSSYDFRIGKEDPRLFRIYNGHLNLIPANHVWGKCEYTDVKRKDDAVKFMADLEAAGARKTQLPIGNYDEFYLHSPGSTEQKMIQGERYEYPFVYAYDGDPAVLQEVLNAYRDKVKITLKSSKGAVIKNY